MATPTAPPPVAPTSNAVVGSQTQSPFGPAPDQRNVVADGRTTPSWYRTMAVITVVLTLVFAAVATAAALVTRSASQRLENSTAPSLIAVQDLSSSVAEADAAATAVFLSGQTGVEDRGLRNLYSAALSRSSRQTEQVASLIGADEESHAELQNVAVGLVDYSGQVETARVRSQVGQDNADRALQAALDLNRVEIAPSLSIVTNRAQEGFARDSTEGNYLGIAAVLVGLLALLMLVLLQVGMANRSRRIFNLFLLLGTVALLATIIVLGRGLLVRQVALSNAESGGYDSIVATSNLQSSVFELQSDLGIGLLGNGRAETAEALLQIDEDVARIRNRAVLDESDREVAAVDLLEARLSRYRTSVESIAASSGSNQAAAIELFEGEGLSNFNGLNTAIESVLSDNRAQFNSGVAAASDSLWFVPFATIILPILAALGTILGVQRRLGEYQ